MIGVGIVGATGYTGIELVRLLSRHPEADLVAAASRNYASKMLEEVYPQVSGRMGELVLAGDPAVVVDAAACVFLALPQGEAAPWVAAARRQGKKVIDLSADFRLQNGEVYRQWYRLEPPPADLLAAAVYGLPELHGPVIRESWLVANPGCYPTSAILALAPALSAKIIDPQSIIIDAKSGVTGAGRGLALGSLYPEINEGVHPYQVAAHRHTPEIEQEVGRLAGEQITVSFTPHLIPMSRGILSTVYARLAPGWDTGRVRQVYQEYYAGQPFVRLLPAGTWPHTKWVYGSNGCLLNLAVDSRTGRLVVAAAIDNLVKGASGQAVQNFNIMQGLPPATGLEGSGIFP